MIEEAWDAICDGVAYVLGFEWVSDLWEFFGSMFENMAEFSVIGLLFGMVGIGTIFLAKDYMLEPFLKYMGPIESMFWTVATYLGCFIAGYLVGKHFENT